MTKAVSASILIPTHNRCEVLQQTLRSLSLVDFPQDVELQLVVVANACTDRTHEVVAAAAPSLPFPVKCVDEPEPGLSVARNRCMAESTGEIVMFLDDDVWVEPQWLRELLHVYDNCKADIAGGPIRLWWAAVDPPAWFAPEFEYLLSAIEHGNAVIELHAATALFGANFSYRRKVFDAVGGFSKSLGRSGSKMRSGEETDFLQRALDAKFRAFYSPGAVVKHWVAPQRVSSLKYISRVAVGNGEAEIFTMNEPLTWRLAIHLLYYNTRWVLGYGVVEACCRIFGSPVNRVRYRLRSRVPLGRIKGVISLILSGRSSPAAVASSRGPV